jgi:hypothetical protein
MLEGGFDISVAVGESISVGSAELMLLYPVISVSGVVRCRKKKNGTACNLFQIVSGSGNRCE